MHWQPGLQRRKYLMQKPEQADFSSPEPPGMNIIVACRRARDDLTLKGSGFWPPAAQFPSAASWPEAWPFAMHSVQQQEAKTMAKAAVAVSPLEGFILL